MTYFYYQKIQSTMWMTGQNKYKLAKNCQLESKANDVAICQSFTCEIIFHYYYRGVSWNVKLG